MYTHAYTHITHKKKYIYIYICLAPIASSCVVAKLSLSHFIRACWARLFLRCVSVVRTCNFSFRFCSPSFPILLPLLSILSLRDCSSAFRSLRFASPLSLLASFSLPSFFSARPYLALSSVSFVGTQIKSFSPHSARGGLSRSLPTAFSSPPLGFYISLSFVSPDRVFHSKIERQRACRARIFAAKTANSRSRARLLSYPPERASGRDRPALVPLNGVLNSHFARVMRPPRSEFARVHSRVSWARPFLPPPSPLFLPVSIVAY